MDDHNSNTGPTARVGVPTTAGLLYMLDGTSGYYIQKLIYSIPAHKLEMIISLDYVVNHLTGTAVVLNTDVDVILIASITHATANDMRSQSEGPANKVSWSRTEAPGRPD